jgi:hypothetical protein
MSITKRAKQKLKHPENRNNSSGCAAVLYPID